PGRPRRKQYWVGASTVATLAANRLAPALLDRYLARTGYDSQQASDLPPPHGPGNLDQPADGAGQADHGAHGVFGDRAHPRSAQQALSRHLVLAGAAGTAGAALAAAAARRFQRRRNGQP
ncbi:MAG: short-chain dehydrogenase, partial [Actinobacteria bacterium]|nr:short-chain dehydrogenase [Actinomycetota bacterium]